MTELRGGGGVGWGWGWGGEDVTIKEEVSLLGGGGGQFFREGLGPWRTLCKDFR